MLQKRAKAGFRSMEPLPSEMVQHHVACFVTNTYDGYSSVTTMISQLQWARKKRSEACIILVYEIINSLVCIKPISHTLSSRHQKTLIYITTVLYTAFQPTLSEQITLSIYSSIYYYCGAH